MKPLEFVVTAALVLIGWPAIVLQGWILVHGAPDPVRATVNFFSFFTIQTNILAAIVSTWMLARERGNTSPVSASVRGAATAYIAMVSIVYEVILRKLWDPTGLQKIVDVALHDVVPILFVAAWLAFAPKGTLRFKKVSMWLVYPLAYLAYSLARGALTGWYPYPFIDVSKLGYLKVLINSAGLVVFLSVISAVFIAIDRTISSRRANARRLRT